MRGLEKKKSKHIISPKSLCGKILPINDIIDLEENFVCKKNYALFNQLVHKGVSCYHFLAMPHQLSLSPQLIWDSKREIINKYEFRVFVYLKWEWKR